MATSRPPAGPSPPKKRRRTDRRLLGIGDVDGIGERDEITERDRADQGRVAGRSANLDAVVGALAGSRSVFERYIRAGELPVLEAYAVLEDSHVVGARRAETDDVDLEANRFAVGGSNVVANDGLEYAVAIDVAGEVDTLGGSGVADGGVARFQTF